MGGLLGGVGQQLLHVQRLVGNLLAVLDHKVSGLALGDGANKGVVLGPVQLHQKIAVADVDGAGFLVHPAMQTLGDFQAAGQGGGVIAVLQNGVFLGVHGVNLLYFVGVVDFGFWFPVTAWAAVSARDRRAIVRRVYFLAALRLTGSTWEKLNRWDSFL